MRSLQMGVRKQRKFSLKKWAGMLVVAGMVLNTASPLSALAAKPCGTNGTLNATSIGKYSYTRNTSGETAAGFLVKSPPLQITGKCDGNVPYVYGNGGCGDSLGVDVQVTGISRDDNAPIDKAARDSLTEALLLQPDSFTLGSPGSGSRQIGVTFSHTDVPAGTYNITVEIRGSEGCGVGTAHTNYEVTVTEPANVDTEAPGVQITSPSADNVCLNGMVPVAFTAVDPPQNGAGTGVEVVRAFLESQGGSVNEDISAMLTFAGGPAVTGSVDLRMTTIGTYKVTAEADDMAEHTGYEVSEPFTVSAHVAALPPLAVVGRQFKVGSTLPIRWTITDCDGNLLPPFASVNIDILYNDSANSYETRVTGEAADAIRWELDELGHALHYTTNFTIPAAGTYGVKVYLTDTDGKDVQQGETLTFTAAYKGERK